MLQATLIDGVAFDLFPFSDDLFVAGALEKCAGLLNENLKMDFAFGKLQMVKSEFLNINKPISDEWPIIGGITLSAGLFRTDLIRKVGDFNRSLSQGEDLDFLLRIAEITRNQLRHNNIVFYYRRHDTNATKNVEAMRSGMLRVLLLHAIRRRNDSSLFDGKGFFYVEEREKLEKAIKLYG